MSRFNSLFSKISEWGALALLVVLPLAAYPAQGALLHSKIGLLAIVAFVSLLVTTLAAFGSKSVRDSLPTSWILGAAWLVPVIYLLSAMFSAAKTRSFVGTGAESMTALAILLAVAGFTTVLISLSRSKAVRGTHLLMAVGGFAALFQLVRILVGAQTITLGGALPSITATLLGSTHDLAAFLALAVLVAAAVLMKKSDSMQVMWAAYATMALSLVVLIIANVFDVWVGLAFSALVIGFVFWYKSGMTGMAGLMRVLPFSIVAVVAIVGATVGSFLVAVLPQSIQLTEIDVRPSWQGTVSVMQGVYSNGGTMFGSGPNTFAKSWSNYKPVATNDTLFWDVDFPSGVGYIPTAFVEVGVLGALAWLLFMVLYVFTTLRSLMTMARQGEKDPLLISLFVGTVLLWVLHIFYTPGFAVTATTLLATALAIILAGSRAASTMHDESMQAESRTLMSMKIPVVFAVMTLVVGYGSISIFRALDADLILRDTVAYFNQSGDIDGTNMRLKRAQSVAPQQDAIERAFAELSIVSLSKTAAEQPKTTAEQEALVAKMRTLATDAVNHAKAATVFDPTDYKNWLSLAQVYETLAGAGVQGASDAAKDAYMHVSQDRPQNPFPFLRLAVIATAGSNAAEAEAYLGQAVKLKPTYAPAHFLGSQIALATGSTTAAINSALAVAQYAPQDPLSWFWLGALLLRSNDAQDAIISLEKAVQLYPDYANALYLLGVAYDRVGKTPDALRAFEKLDKLNPNNPDIQQALANLRTGKHVLATPAVTR